MNRILQTEHLWQAEQFADLLLEKKIECDIQFQPREYAEVVTGTSAGLYNVMVDSEKVEESALQLLLFNQQNSTRQDASAIELNPSRRIFKKIVFFSFASIVSFPILFNWVAWLNLKELGLKTKDAALMRLAWFAFLLPFPCFAILIWYWMHW